MTHRTDIEWIDITKPQEEIYSILLDIQHSKILCCEENMDNFKGILYLKDFYRSKASGNDININDVLVEPLIVPENIDAQKVLNLFRQKKKHICCVVNEYGGFEGIITLHDIFENIVGEFPEEGETNEPDYFIREDKSVLVNGDASVEVLGEIMDDFVVDFEKIDYSTVAGFVFKQINKIPHLGDQFQYNHYIIEIIDLDGNKIDKILIKRKD